ncbi:MAG: DNA topoisomerase 3 [Lachnospiraceae bacterium]|nr:DNA topoisomerase 3 [Lachnospiraceae bacterium]
MKLVITEKPSVAKAIAEVIGAAQKQEGYYEGEDYLVSWCIGHLIGLAPPESYKESWKNWNYKGLPIVPKQWNYVVKADTKEQYHVLYQLLHREEVSTIICGTDSGREGELIFRLVYEMAGCKKPVKRLWISSMEESAIRKGFEELRPEKDYDNLYASALCRQKADWLVGMNGTRLFTVLYGGKLLKVGRVQTPTLAMLVERELKIRDFIKETYFIVHIYCGEIEAVSEKIRDRKEAEEMERACLNGQAFVTSIVEEEKATLPPKLYDLTTLQREANQLFGFTAKQTLEYTQSLYEKKLVTYPRTDSQFVTDSMGQTIKQVIEGICHSGILGESLSLQPEVRNILDSTKVTDHHAIIPTIEITNVDIEELPEAERKVLALIAKRLLCATGEKYLYKTGKATISCNPYTFTVSGKFVVQDGWKEFDNLFRSCFQINRNEKEEKLPALTKGQVFQKIQVKISEHETQPFRHYTEDTLLSAMEHAGEKEMGTDVERKGLGTPATRADIIEKLVKDGFAKREKKQILPTEDGIKLIAILPDVVKSPKLTSDWENALTLVAKGELAMEDFMADIEHMVEELVSTYHEVSDEQKKMFAKEQEALGICPNCGGQVAKGKFGAYCTKKCGMNISRVMGVLLTDTQVKDMLAGKKILLKGLKSKAGKSYDAYVVPSGTEKYHYMKDGEEKSGVQFKIVMEFPKKNLSKEKK